MIALLASVMLGLYLLLPDFLFDRFTAKFGELKRRTRTRVEELAAGVVVVLFPLLATYALVHISWYLGHYPHWPASDDSLISKSRDYQIVFSSLYSEHYFDANERQFWDAFYRTVTRQFRFLCWFYSVLALEIWFVRRLTANFYRIVGSAGFKRFTSWILRRASQWETLLTTFVFNPKENRSVQVDILTGNGQLYRGTIGDKFFDKDGNLEGILLLSAQRFRQRKYLKDEDAAGGKSPPAVKYWKDIPGKKFYIVAKEISTINLDYVLPGGVTLQKLLAEMKRLRQKNK
jgi:hypothetical protein